MAKFGRFELGKVKPLETYDGDFMECEGGYVKIFEGSPIHPSGQSDPPRLLCAIRLSGGQRVAKIKD